MWRTSSHEHEFFCPPALHYGLVADKGDLLFQLCESERIRAFLEDMVRFDSVLDDCGLARRKPTHVLRPCSTMSSRFCSPDRREYVLPKREPVLLFVLHSTIALWNTGFAKYRSNLIRQSLRPLQVALAQTIAEFLAPSESESRPTILTRVDPHDAAGSCFGIQPLYTPLARPRS